MENCTKQRVHTLGTKWWPRPAGSPFHHVHPHLPHWYSWKHGDDNVGSYGLSFAHIHVLFPLQPLSCRLGLFLSCHSHGYVWVLCRFQGGLVQCLCCTDVLLCRLCHWEKLHLSINDLWPLCSSMQTRALLQQDDNKCLVFFWTLTLKPVVSWMPFFMLGTYSASLFVNLMWSITFSVMFLQSWPYLSLIYTSGKRFLLFCQPSMSSLLFWSSLFPISL